MSRPSLGFKKEVFRVPRVHYARGHSEPSSLLRTRMTKTGRAHHSCPPAEVLPDLGSWQLASLPTQPLGTRAIRTLATATQEPTSHSTATGESFPRFLMQGRAYCKAHLEPRSGHTWRMASPSHPPMTRAFHSSSWRCARLPASWDRATGKIAGNKKCGGWQQGRVSATSLKGHV